MNPKEHESLGVNSGSEASVSSGQLVIIPVPFPRLLKKKRPD